MEHNTIEDLASKLSHFLPPAPNAIKKEIEENIRGLVQKSISRMDLVTREEFEIQSAVLQRTRIRLEALEKKVSLMEESLVEKSPNKK